jgi:hypothetical protein
MIVIINHDIGGIEIVVCKTKGVKMFDSRFDAYHCCNCVEASGIFLESCTHRLKASCQSKANDVTSLNKRSKMVRSKCDSAQEVSIPGSSDGIFR